MNFDFALLLTALTALAGLIWATDALLFAKQRAAQNEQQGEGERKLAEPWVVEQARSFLPVLLIVLVVRSFWFEPFKIPSPSMVPTLLVGDFIVVNKYAYGLRLPVLNTKIVNVGAPKRGDVVVFRRPRSERLRPGQVDPDEGKNFIKRLIGLPGDRINVVSGTLFVNGNTIEVEPLGNYTVTTGAQQERLGTELFNEALDEKGHQILIHPNSMMLDGEWVVPEGHYMMIGDNRTNSADSRDWGMVPEANLIGRASFIWFHFDLERSGVVAWSRIGKAVN